MALLTTGKPFIKDLESNGAIAVRMPLEGGFEGRYERRLKATGYETMNLTARGLGDVSSYLTAIHGVRPPHLGKKTVGSGAAVGYTHFVPPMLTYRLDTMSAKAKGMVLWLIEGHILSRQELAYLVSLPTLEPRVKVVVEMGGDRAFSWKPLANLI
ncbi:NAD(P)H-quinone oxidoreductase subunit N [Phormidium tenue]|uniref:NAD(P)H-quinone oxidoreductase subunit N n=1 Tax=Phormidium tenue NIES-30 TaxID=549789 RepID=A0A1U7J2P9_9CYAN|nr:NAD(P)H-quinone oxidoreductase subunit N [Phormidium tenue]MBD2231848.1 NAD(P)H-quinone oxidoreductase subunit N [Phormidium tenue FACHB-1052]OKH46407.1 NAD(P)H-quinone oxidoreductase [Phormidium tenue NIES-30]